MSASPLPPPLTSPRLQAYLDALVAACERSGPGPVGVVVFGSAARGGFAAGVSDVDVLVVLADGASAEDLRRVREEVVRLEVAHGLREPRESPPGPLLRLVERAVGSHLSCFVCTRTDLLSGDVARVLGLGAVEALLVDRIVLASIVASAVTVRGEDLLPRVPVPPVRRLDVLKAWFAFTCQVLLSAAAYPLLPQSTGFAMDALKRSVHSCYFCHHARSAPLEEEVEFFAGIGADRALRELLALRGRYRPSFAFVVRCIPALLRLHAHAARHHRFPPVRPLPSAPA